MVVKDQQAAFENYLNGGFLLYGRDTQGGQPRWPDENKNEVPNQQEANNEAPASFEAILEKDPKIKELYEQHTAGLLNTVKATREERDGLKNQVKELLTKSEKGSENEKALTETLLKLEATERRAAFVEEAVKPGIDCRNPKAATHYAVTVDAFDKKIILIGRC